MRARLSSHANLRLADTLNVAMAPRPTIIRNPPNDAAFEQAIEDMLDSGPLEPDAAQERLRAVYPKAVVRPRELANETTPVWYVYREGRWIGGD